MEITNEAKQVLENILTQKQSKGFIFEASGHGCHTRLNIRATNECSGNTINGLYIDMNEQSAECLDGLTIDIKEGKLVFINNCGNCKSGCH